jgi:cytidylate kinase
MDKQIIITVGRQFGSGGRIIGKELAEAFRIGFYDKELITFAAKESGLCPEVFEKADERASDRLSHAFSLGLSAYPGMYNTPYSDILSGEGLFKIQSDAIRKLAEAESCVIVGRCADYILRDHPGCISFFIHDSLANRIRRIAERQQVSPEQAKDLIAKADKSRAAYYNYYTNKTWGMSASYNFSVDVSVLGIGETVRFMQCLIEKKQALLG